MPDITLKLLRRVTERLDEANELVSIYRSKMKWFVSPNIYYSSATIIAKKVR